MYRLPYASFLKTPTIFALSVSIGAAFFAFSAPQTQAANVGTLLINGQVPAVCSVDITQEPGAINIPNISLGDTNRLVATIEENCNNPGGYTVTVSGANSTDHTGLFVDTVSADSHGFTIRYGTDDILPGGLVTDSNVPRMNESKTVDITYPPNLTLTPSAGFTYEETLSFTVVAK